MTQLRAPKAGQPIAGGYAASPEFQRFLNDLVKLVGGDGLTTSADILAIAQEALDRVALLPRPQEQTQTTSETLEADDAQNILANRIFGNF